MSMRKPLILKQTISSATIGSRLSLYIYRLYLFLRRLSPILKNSQEGLGPRSIFC